MQAMQLESQRTNDQQTQQLLAQDREGFFLKWFPSTFGGGIVGILMADAGIIMSVRSCDDERCNGDLNTAAVFTIMSGATIMGSAVTSLFWSIHEEAKRQTLRHPLPE